MKPKKTVRKSAITHAEPFAPVEDGSATGQAAVRRVLFDVHLGGAREVYLVGTFNDWHLTTLPMVNMGTGRWEKEILLPPGVYEYLLVADGRWLPDPDCVETCPNPFGSVNCVRRVE